MRLGPRRKLRIETERLTLRAPQHADFRQWANLRQSSAPFLQPWEPTWAADHLSRRSFTNRVYWAQRSIANGSALPLFLIRREDEALVGALTLDHIKRGPAQAGTTGYWVGQDFARKGYMSEALTALVHHAFTEMDLSRIEGACLPENNASRAVLGAAAINTRASRKAIFRSTDVGGTTCCMPICGLIGGAKPMSAKLPPLNVSFGVEAKPKRWAAGAVIRADAQSARLRPAPHAELPVTSSACALVFAKTGGGTCVFSSD